MVARGPASTVSRDEAKERLLVEAAQQDPTQFAELYEINFERVYAYIARRVPERDEAQDLTSDVFHRALASLPRFEWRGAPFAAWLFRIAANAIADRWKHSAQERDFYDLDPQGEAPADVSLEEAEQRAQVFRLVDGLPADQRRVIVMRFAEEKSIREIAQELGRSEGAVKQLQFRALEKLRKRLARTGKSDG
ncbi:MAG: RNA polymerase sigma factor [Terriglobia bacterium]